MRRFLLLLSGALFVTAGVTAYSQAPASRNRTLAAFHTDKQFADYLRDFDVAREKSRVEAEMRAARARGCYLRPASLTTRRRKGVIAPATPAIVIGRAMSRETHLAGVSVGVPTLDVATTTSADGSFVFEIPAKRLGKKLDVRLIARRLGFVAAEKTISVEPGDSIRVEFELCPASIVLRGAYSLQAATTGVATYSENITNVQEQGVDEGDIVKMHGKHLVILRRGRLFTVSVDEGQLQPIAAVDAFGPAIDPRLTWYDELMVYGDKAIVVGYSYERGGTEIGVFHIDAAGAIEYVATYQLRSNDYYSSRNYASRLIGSKLVFYAPLFLDTRKNPLDALPSLRKWRGKADDPFGRIASAPRIYRPARPLDPSSDIMLHTVTTCDLATEELTCLATAFVGPSSRVFYVSSRAAYVWISGRQSADQPTLYRMPLDGSAPTALGVRGSPIDQFSFLESNDDHLNVLVLAGARGDAMWRSERAHGAAALLRVAVGEFGDGSRSADGNRYRELPSDSNGVFHNRFVGTYLLYGVGNSWNHPRSASSTVYVVPWKGGKIVGLPLAHRVDRIEPMGRDAVIIGADSTDLHFDGVSLDSMRLAQRFVLANAAQGELRSHGFFYSPDGATSGVLGLPVRKGGEAGVAHLTQGSASILFLRNTNGRLEEIGKLASHDSDGADACKASCVDWYGNARPIFLGGRTFALLGYEVIEGRAAGATMNEVARINYFPHVAELTGR
jgi:beta propeller domain-containing protein